MFRLSLKQVSSPCKMLRKRMGINGYSLKYRFDGGDLAALLRNPVEVRNLQEFCVAVTMQEFDDTQPEGRKIFINACTMFIKAWYESWNLRMKNARSGWVRNKLEYERRVYNRFLDNTLFSAGYTITLKAKGAKGWRTTAGNSKKLR